jgi:hypothetical protein
MRLVLTVLVTTAALSLVNPACARGMRRGRIFQQHAAGSMHRAAPSASVRELYPQYYGGFHARALQNIGIPSGDIGIRGNGIYANPW